MTVFYYLLFIAVLFFVVGFILGFLILIQTFVEEKKEFVQQRDAEQNKKEEPKSDLTEEKKVKKKEKKNGCDFKNRVVDMENSYTNSLEDVSKEEYILEHRSKQDDAYNYIKRKETHKGEKE